MSDSIGKPDMPLSNMLMMYCPRVLPAGVRFGDTNDSESMGNDFHVYHGDADGGHKGRNSAGLGGELAGGWMQYELGTVLGILMCASRRISAKSTLIYESIPSTDPIWNDL